MPPMKGKWAQGIKPRNFAWVITDKLAVCERPGGYGANHRRVRRQEEIIWIREQGFTRVISLIPSPHNLHNYDELGVAWLHRPFPPHEPNERSWPRSCPSCATSSAPASGCSCTRTSSATGSRARWPPSSAGPA